MKKIEKLANAFRTITNEKTGTVVQKAIEKRKIGILCDIELNGVKKLITYGKDTPLRQKGIDRVMITTLNNGDKSYEYFKNGESLFQLSYGKGFMTYPSSNPVMPWECSGSSAEQYLRESVLRLMNP